ncbi:MAG: phosphatidylserine decarboxylase family protein [Flavobacteriales bacterium]|jgi:phosphatidylserine decarboxylase|nr:phosphatidylserine decarboxylase family protein [Flavobacteriales bacterium]|tara:strand:- start:4595 stop:5245 length:651 start_codon:yes stop_codon:yes gene_type:complete
MKLIHKEGYRIILTTIIILIALNYAVSSFAIEWLNTIFLIASLIFMFLILQFFRNPVRKVEASENEVVAPADGKVVVIEEVEETEYFKDKRLQVSIFMSPINVHVNRYPINGKVQYAKYHPGKYLVAWHPKSSTENERTTVVVENDKIAVLFRQIAGALARRIVMYSKENDTAKKGEDFGFIKFGSRVDLFFPIGTKINVELDQVVKGNKTVIARY